MKRSWLIFLLICNSLAAYEFSVDSRNSYLVFDPDQRALLMQYPISWLKPSELLFDHEYEDSSWTYANWNQIYNLNSLSTEVTAKYVPYSFPHRWSAGLSFIDYNSGNSTARTDVVLDFKYKKGEVEYYHTSNEQRILLNTITTDHIIKSHGLKFNYQFTDKFYVSGGLDLDFIDQNDLQNTTLISTRNYDINHELLEIGYSSGKYLSVFTRCHLWNYTNDTTGGRFMLLYPGITYKKPNFKSLLSLRISPTGVHPIMKIHYDFEPIYFEAYTNIRSPRIILNEFGNQYIGFKAGVDVNSDLFSLKADFHTSRDFVPAGQMQIIPNKDISFNAEYKLKTPSANYYLKATSNQISNPQLGYYNPERSIVTAGLQFKADLSNGNLQLTGDLNTQNITHEDPSNVSFDPSTLVYTLIGESNLINDWKINFDLNAIIKTFIISINISSPINFNGTFDYYISKGIYSSSDFATGNTFYAGLKIQWLWWK